MAILRHPASRKNHTNVLMHIRGYFHRALNSRQRAELREVILGYRAGRLLSGTVNAAEALSGGTSG